MSSLQGEVYGLVAAALHVLHSGRDCAPVLYTDHLNSVRYLENLRTALEAHGPPPAAGSPYKWLVDILTRSPLPPDITYAPAHTSAQSIPARANRTVDRLASCSHSNGHHLLAFSLPDFFLPDYCLYSRDGFIESSISNYIASCLDTLTASSPDFRPAVNLAILAYSDHPPPSRPDIRASSAYSPLVQLYARCGQLDTAVTRFIRFGDLAPWRRSGCPVFETAHHVFAHCPIFTSFRASALTALRTEVTELLATAESPPTLKVPTLGRDAILPGHHAAGSRR